MRAGQEMQSSCPVITTPTELSARISIFYGWQGRAHAIHSMGLCVSRVNITYAQQGGQMMDITLNHSGTVFNPKIADRIYTCLKSERSNPLAH
jgi:hypothetical protein